MDLTRNSTLERCGSSRQLPLIVAPDRWLESVMLIAVSLIAMCAELPHLREDVDDAPGLSDSAVDDPENEDFVIGDGFTGWWETHGVGIGASTVALVMLLSHPRRLVGLPVRHAPNEGCDRWINKIGWRSASSSTDRACGRSPIACSARSAKRTTPFRRRGCGSAA